MPTYDILQSASGVRVIGSVDWSPEDWDYQTNDATVEHLLATVITIEFKGRSTMITQTETIPHEEVMRSIEMFGKEVFPRIREAKKSKAGAAAS